MSLEFPFLFVEIESLGRLFYPFVRVQLKTTSGWQEFNFLVDTGADVTTLPQHMLPVLALDKRTLKKQKVRAVGGIWVETLETNIPVRIGNDEFPIHVSITNTKGSIPLLLGRKDILERRFSLVIDSKRKLTILKKNA